MQLTTQFEKSNKLALRKNFRKTLQILKNWKTLKQLRLPEKRPPSGICLKAKEGLTFDPFTISELFKKLYSNLAHDLVQKIPAAAKKFGIESVKIYYDYLFSFTTNKFSMMSCSRLTWISNSSDHRRF